MAFLACDEFRALLADELSGADGPEREMRSHLAACAPCAAHAGEILWQDRVLAELSARARLEPLLARVRESLLSTRPVEFAQPPLRVRAPRPRWGRAAVAAALFLAALAALLLFRPTSGDRVVIYSPERVGPFRNTGDSPAPKPDETPAATQVVQDTPPREPSTAPQSSNPDLVKKADPPKKDPAVSKSAPPPEPPPAPQKPIVGRTPVVPDAAAQHIVLNRTRTVDEAVREGMGYLQKKSPAIEAMRIHHDLRYDELVLWTYRHGGMAEGDPEFQKVLRRMLERKLERTYAVALQAMSLEKLDRVAHQGRIQQCAQFLVDNQCKNGQWGYGDPSIFAEEVAASTAVKTAAPAGVKKFAPPKEPPGPDGPKVVKKVIVRKMRQGPESGDHSNSMYAALGLRACHDSGILLAKEDRVVALAQKAWRDAQIKPEGGWCYGRHEGHKSYGSMTAGGVGSLVIYDYIAGDDWKRDLQVKAGLDWLEKKFSVTFNPGPYEHSAREENTQQQYFYYMYALERAAILFGTASIGKNDWYAKGSEALLGCQRQDGSWASKEGGNEVSDTCFAILFLRRATRALPEVSTGTRPK